MIASACSVRPTASAMRMTSPAASFSGSRALRASARSQALAALRQSSAALSMAPSAGSRRAVARGSVVVKVRTVGGGRSLSVCTGLRSWISTENEQARQIESDRVETPIKSRAARAPNNAEPLTSSFSRFFLPLLFQTFPQAALKEGDRLQDYVSDLCSLFSLFFLSRAHPRKKA